MGWPNGSRAQRLGVGLAALALLLAGLAAARQGWEGEAVLRGRVLDSEGSPVAGARVTLTLPAAADEGPPVLSSGNDGRFVARGLAAGRWRVVVEAPGHRPSDGWYVLDPEAPRPLEIELLGTDESNPALGGGENLEALRRALLQANELLAAGRTAEARGRFEEAVPFLADAALSEVLRAIARTHYLEGDVDAAVASLEEALDWQPAFDETRELYRTLMAGLGRSEEAERFLDELSPMARPSSTGGRGGGGRADASVAPSARRVMVEAVPAEADRVGAATVRLPRRDPLSAVDGFRRRFGYEAGELRKIDPDALAYDLADESFDLVVPESYRRGVPHGVVVWVSAVRRGGVADPAMREMLAERKLIWIGANRSGNPRPFWDRVGLALDAAGGVRSLYDVDPERVFVAGFSGGGRVASALAFEYPEVFRAGVFWFGIDYFAPVAVPFKPGHSWPARFPKPPRHAVRLLVERSRFALVTGELDFNRAEIRAIARRMREDGLIRQTLIEIPAAGHYLGLDAEWFGRALDAVDGRLPE